MSTVQCPPLPARGYASDAQVGLYIELNDLVPQCTNNVVQRQAVCDVMKLYVLYGGLVKKTVAADRTDMVEMPSTIPAVSQLTLIGT